MRRELIGIGLLCSWCAMALAASPPPDVVAQVGDVKVTKDMLADDLAQIKGKEILDNLIQEKLVLQEITRRRLVIPDDAVEGRMKALDFRVKSQSGGDMGLTGLLQKRGASVESQRQGVKLLLAIETMAKMDLRMHPEEPISNLKVAKWLKSLLDNAKIVGRSGNLPKGAYASINGEILSEEDFQRVLFLNSDANDIQYALERIISKILVDKELEKRSMTVTRADVDSELARMEKVIQRNPQNRLMKLEDVLRLKGASTIELQADPNFRTRVAAKKMIRAQIAPAEAQEFCDQHKALYGNGKVRASQILISFYDPKTNMPRGETAQADALRKVTDLHVKLRGGADFADLARQFSDDPQTAQKGGDLGFFPRYGVVADPVAGAAFLNRKDEFSGILASPLGYYLVKTTDVQAPPTVDIEKVRDWVMDDMCEARMPEWLANLRNSGGVQIFYK